jgi:hypothetical protein
LTDTGKEARKKERSGVEGITGGELEFLSRRKRFGIFSN